MSAWWVAFAAGWAAGLATAVTVMASRATDREQRIYEEGVRAGRDGLAPWRPVDADHPSHGHHRERGVSDVTAVLGGVLCAAAVLWCSGTFGGGL